MPYVDQMQYAYAAADFAICRCGAMTCAELAAVGLPAAYVPCPCGDGEQRFNAEPIVEAGGGLLVDDADLTPAWIVAEVVPRITDPDRLRGDVAAAARAGVARRRRRARAEHTRDVVAEYRRVDRRRGHPEHRCLSRPGSDHCDARTSGRSDWAAPGAALVRSAATDPVPPLAELGRVHIMGIAGAGMSGLARILLERGVPVSGCEARESMTASALRAMGAEVRIGHSAGAPRRR